jgi:hypothetical protein
MRARVGVSIITETGAVAIHEFISSRAVIFIRPVLCINQEPECVEEAVMMPGSPQLTEFRMPPVSTTGR